MNNSTIRPARAGDEPGIRALWRAAFDEPRMVPLWELDPDRHRHTLLMVEYDGTIAASVYYLPRNIRNADGRIDSVAGLANVATLPSARGRGYSRRLLAAHRNLAEKEGADWALLFTGTPGVYAGSGWQGFSQRHRLGTIADQDFDQFLGAAHVTQGSFDRINFRPLHLPLEQIPLATVRTPMDWSRTRIWYQSCVTFTAASHSSTVKENQLHKSSDVIGYLVLDLTQQIAWITELATPTREIAQALIAKALGYAQDHDFAEVLFRLPDTTTTGALAAQFLKNPTWRQDDTAMVLPLRKTIEQVTSTITHTPAFHSSGDYL